MKINMGFGIGTNTNGEMSIYNTLDGSIVAVMTDAGKKITSRQWSEVLESTQEFEFDTETGETKREFFPLGILISRADIANIEGADEEAAMKIDDSDMYQIADKLKDDYFNQLYHSSITIIADYVVPAVFEDNPDRKKKELTEAQKIARAAHDAFGRGRYGDDMSNYPEGWFDENGDTIYEDEDDE